VRLAGMITLQTGTCIWIATDVTILS